MLNRGSLLNDVTEDNRSQGDGGDGVQEHGGGLYHAADGAGLIHQILDCVWVELSTVPPAGNSPPRFYAPCSSHRWFLWPRDLLLRRHMSTMQWSLRQTSRNTFCGHAVICAKQNRFRRRAKKLHTRIRSNNWNFNLHKCKPGKPGLNG